MDSPLDVTGDSIELASAARFADRVSNYTRYRPGYPDQALSFIQRETGLVGENVVADLGSGTGIWSRLLLEAGYRVVGVEPSPEMRGVAESTLASFDAFQSVDGRSDQTGLAPDSVDLITAAQAFHWFDISASRRECQRILKDQGFVALLWNERLTDASPFLMDYEALLQAYATDYNQVNHAKLPASVFPGFYGHDKFRVASFPNIQHFDYEGLEGRLLSCSYVPNEEQPGYRPMLDALKKVFEQRAVEGRVAFEYQTRVYCGQLKP